MEEPNIYAKDWLNIYWPLDEYLFIEHVVSKKFETYKNTYYFIQCYQG